jgi:hypothetical protein
MSIHFLQGGTNYEKDDEIVQDNKPARGCRATYIGLRRLWK